ncbi:unnamed protein product [Brachionus calyciflorus]|uniref:Craniofacial development protein 1 n=1 Tax=Brachionus calyciflorus TaxID=104777 RepID=A0A814FIC4_9BILA|nr:unnamed protein product [Brachionus calyciflorus]
MSKKVSIKNLQNLEDADDDDEEDEDYVPDKESDDEESDTERKKRKIQDESDEDEFSSESNKVIKSKKNDEIEPITEENKKKADEIWTSFLKDVKSVPAKPNIDYGKKYESTSTNTKTVTQELNKKTDQIKSRTNFSNFESKSELKEPELVEKETNDISSKIEPKKKPLGMAGILEKIGKQEKLSTLDKSKIDWEQFKKEQKIEEDLATQTKGKDSYLDKQAFLERADLRQFELEKELRNKERKQRDPKF